MPTSEQLFAVLDAGGDMADLLEWVYNIRPELQAEITEKFRAWHAATSPIWEHIGYPPIVESR